MSKSALNAIAWGGLVAGTIDIGAASLINWLSPIFICKVVAGGLLGKAALQGGNDVAAFGMILQWIESFIIAAVYVSAADWLPVLKRQWLLFGLAYGVGIFFVMNYVVVPLSAWHRFPHMAWDKFTENMAAMLLFGVIVAYFAARTDDATSSR